MVIGHLASSLANLRSFVITWLTFFVAGIISFLIVIISNRQRLTPLGFIRHCFPFECWRKKSTQMDFKIYLATKLTDKIYARLIPLCTVLISALVSNSFKPLFPSHIPIQPNYLIILCCSILLFITGEFSNYLTHYLQHYIPILWELHKVHHSATFLNPLTVRREHPFGKIFDVTVGAILVGIPAGLFLIFLKFSLAGVLFLQICANRLGIIITMDTLKHSHFPIRFGPLERILISPYMHQIHHSTKAEHWDKNFGHNLSIWDWIFRTVSSPVIMKR